MSAPFERIQAIVLEARETPAPDRAAFLDHACDGDSELREEVESLLAHDASDDPRLRTGGAPLAPPDSAREPEPVRVGNYRVLERIGEGGFGDVYAAEQEAPIRRRVALKILKRGMDTRSVLARFRAERQALAQMDHPHIARILDAGETETGRPFYVMDWIRGERITAYCETRALDVRRRVSLMADVADAVAHAHRQGIVHRDIKPTNVLVATRDGVPWPSVIDFGIAKAIGSPLVDHTLFTTEGQLLGTPAYMSPEQAAGADVGPATDVYSLGALLYELLAGTPPIPHATLHEVGIGEIPRLIRNLEPRPPSTCASAGVRRDCRGELDWITLTALERQPEHRYPDAASLAADLRRYLRGEPIEAAAASATYRSRRRLRRGIRRLRDGLSGVAVRTGMSVKLALQARQIAEERDRAKREHENAERVAAFLSRMLGSVQPAKLGESLWMDLRARIADADRRAARTPDETREMLSRLDAAVSDANPTNVALRLLDEEILARAGRTIDDLEDVEIAARLRATLGETYTELGMLETAEPYVRSALGERRRVLGDDHPETIHTLSSLGILLQRQGRLEEAERCARDALGRAHAALGEDHRETLESLTNLGVVLAHQGKQTEAEDVRRRSMAAHRRVFGEKDLQTITAIGNLGTFLTDVGKHREAEGYLRECLDLSKACLGEDDGTTISAGNNLAMLLEQTGRSEEAEPLMRAVLASSRRVRGDDHMETLIAQSNLATILEHQGKYTACEQTLRDTLEHLERVAGATHLYTLGVRLNLGATLQKLGRADEAERHARRAFDAYATVHGLDHPHALNAASNLGDALTALGRLDEAATVLADAINRASRVLSPSDWLLAVLRVKRARVHEARGEVDCARRELEQAHERFVSSLGATHERTQDAARRLVDLFEAAGNAGEARRWQGRAGGYRARPFR